jgi:hypothetical protein
VAILLKEEETRCIYRWFMTSISITSSLVLLYPRYSTTRFTNAF